jgi:hypothetical protein
VADQPHIRLAWDPDAEPVTAKDAGAVDALLRDLHRRFDTAGAPTLVVLDREGEHTSLAVGLGGNRAMLSWLRNGDPAEDLTSLGPGEDANGLVEFRYAGTESEFPTAVLIDLDDALTAAHDYAANGRRPGNVEWQEI